MFIILLLTWLVLGQFVMTGETIGSCYNNIALNTVGKLWKISERSHHMYATRQG